MREGSGDREGGEGGRRGERRRVLVRVERRGAMGGYPALGDALYT